MPIHILAYNWDEGKIMVLLYSRTAVCVFSTLNVLIWECFGTFLYSLWWKEFKLIDCSDEAKQCSHLLRGAARRHVRHLDHIGAGRHYGSDLMMVNVNRKTFKSVR